METITVQLELPVDIVRRIEEISAEVDGDPCAQELMEACIIEKFRDKSVLEGDEEVPF